jgi:Xaa-Pro dipeptidase
MQSLVFPPSEFEGRLDRIREEMSSRKLDGLILTRPQNIYYATGYRGAQLASVVSQLLCVVIPARGEPRFMTRKLEEETVRTQWTKNPRLYMDHEDPFQVLAGIVKESRNESGKLGIEEGFLTVRQLARFKKALPNAKFVDTTGLVEGIRATPTKAESECIRRAAKVTSIGFQKGVEVSHEGVYPYEIVGEIHRAMYAAGQSDFDTSFVAIWSGPKGGLMHDTNATEKIRRGDIITLEVHGVDKMYKAVAQGSLYVGGKPPGKIIDEYELAMKMYHRGKNAVRPEAKAEEVYNAANSIYRATRGRDYHRRMGGSVGLGIFDINFVPRSKDILKPGLGLIVQPVLNDPVLIACVGTAMVTKDGVEELTKPSPELTVV